MMASLRTIFLSSYLLILLPFVFAIPSDLYQSSCNDASRPTKSFISAVRDSVIQRFWGLPIEYQRSNPGLSQPASAAAPPNLRAQYGGDVVLRFNVSSNEEMKALAEAAETLYLDVWESTEQWVDIRLAKEVVSLLLGLLPESLHTAHTPLMHDLAQAIYESYPSSSAANQQLSTVRHEVFTPSLGRIQDEPSGERDLFFRDYQPMSVIMPWMRLMASLFPTHTRMFNIGYSYEGRDIPALKVGVHPTNAEQPSEPRRTILIVGGGHAREWISTSTITYIVYQMITGYGKSQEITKLLEEFDWVFVPTVNPDGYVYTWDIDRLWRKNRQQTDLRFCQGVDLDRAWSFQWDGESTRSNPCSESYAGVGPFDGVEARRLADWARNETENNNVELVAFLDLHSYSQQVLYPYSFSCQSTPPSLENLEELAMGLAKSIRLTNNHFYGVNSACNGGGFTAKGRKKGVTAKMDSGGGSALDWFYHEMGVKYAYQIKLRDTGSYGFLLPRENIIPTGKEAFNAVTGLGRFLLGNRGIETSHGSHGEEASVDRVEQGRSKSSVDVAASDGFAQDEGSEVGHNEPEERYIHQPELRRRRGR